MSDVNSEFPTVIGADAKFKGDLSFEKGVRIEGSFEGQIASKGILHVAEGAVVTANVEASNVRVEGQCKGNLVVSEKLHLLATAKMEGDLRANRLEIADGAIFVGNVVVGQTATDASIRRPSVPGGDTPTPSPKPGIQQSGKPNPTQSPDGQRPRPQEIRVGQTPS